MTAISSAQTQLGRFEHRVVTVSVMLATIMQALDTTIANVALPHMQGSLSGTQDQMAWVLTSYIVAAAIMTPLTGWLAPRFGRKRVFLISIVAFTIASTLCGIAESLSQIVFFRLVQGIAGAALIPMSQAILLDINPREKTAQAMSLWGSGTTLAPILGPIIGGWLTDNYSWRWVFLINVPVGVLAFVLLLAALPANKARQGQHFDFLGFGALSVAVGSFQLMLDRGELKGWFGSSEIITEATIAGLGIYTFIVHTLTTDRPFISFGLFKDRNFVIGTLNAAVLSAILLCTMSLTPPLLQNLMNYPVTTTGLVMGPRGIGVLIAMFATGRLFAKVNQKFVAISGMLLLTWSAWAMAHFTLDMGWEPFVLWAVIQGLGLGLSYISLMTLSFGTLPISFRSEGTAISALIRNLGQSMGISVGNALLTSNTQIVHSNLAEHIRLDNPIFNAARFPFDVSGESGLSLLNAMVTRQAAMVGYIDDFWLGMWLSIVATPFILLLRTQRRSGDEPSHVALD
jgi:DHA2 family multidrug resistance protein